MKLIPPTTSPAGRVSYQQQVKEANLKRAFDLVRCGKCRSRSDLVRAMQLSATSVSTLVEDLAQRSLVVETGTQPSALPGRRPVQVVFNKDAFQVPVFSLDARGVRFTLLNLACDVLESFFVPLEDPQRDPDERYAALFEDILLNRSRRFDRGRALVVGICYPGVYRISQRIFSMTFTIGTVITEDAMTRFQARVGLPLCLSPSYACQAYAEKKTRDARNPDGPELQDLVYVDVGDHLGSAYIVNGSIHLGPHNTAGMIGHISIDHHGERCVCGNNGCLQNYVNMNRMLDDIRAACLDAGLNPPASIRDLSDGFLDQPPVIKVLDEAAELLSYGIYSSLCSSGVTSFVIGGQATALGDGFLNTLYRALCRRQPLTAPLKLEYAQAGPYADAVGIAQYYLDKMFIVSLSDAPLT